MTVESTLFDSIKALVSNRVYPLVGPEGVATPYITYQQVGGQPANFLAGLPSKRNGRFQINTWAQTGIEAKSLIRQIEDLVRSNSALLATTEGGAVDVLDEDTKLHGARQDFSIWFDA